MLSGNLHGGSVVASYPFDDSPSHEQQGHYSETEDDSLFRYLARVYSRNHPVMRIGQPNCSGSIDETFKDGIVNGAQWYDVPGKIVHIKSYYMDRCLWLLCLVSGCSGVVLKKGPVNNLWFLYEILNLKKKQGLSFSFFTFLFLGHLSSFGTVL